MNSTVMQTWIEACCIRMVAPAVNIVLCCINNLNFIIPSINWDSCVIGVTGYWLNPRVSVSDIRQKKTSRCLFHASNVRSAGERRAKIDACRHCPPVPMAIKCYITTMPAGRIYGWLLRRRRTSPAPVPSVTSYGAVRFSSTHSYIVGRWRCSASYPCCFIFG